MWKMIAYPITASLLILGGCSKLDTPQTAEESCEACHTTPLSKSAVHRLHLTSMAMADFPVLDKSAAGIPVMSMSGDTTIQNMIDPAYKFSNSATIDRAARYKQNRLLSYGIKCADCHNGLDPNYINNADNAHRNGVKDASFDQDKLLAQHYNPDGVDTVHYTANPPASMRMDANGCSNITCHGAGRVGVLNVTWNTSASFGDTLSCMGCHNTTKHKVGVACDKCHYDVTLDNGKTIHNFRKHLNDTINYGRY